MTGARAATTPRRRRVLDRGIAPRDAALGGVVASGLIAAGSGLLPGDVGHPAQAMFLVVPVVVVALVGGRHGAVAVGAAAALSFSLLLPPIGSPRVHLVEDIVSLVAFSVVALVIGSLVALRVESLRQVDRHHASLLRAVSHDLRTPLASIQAALSELEEPDVHGPAARLALATTARVEAERLERLVANLLSLARIEAGALRPDRRPVDLQELVAGCAGRLAGGPRHVEVGIQVPAELPMAVADHALLQQVVGNLLENAARHAPEGSTLTIVLGHDGDALSLEVLDEGPGLRPEELAVIFEPFRSGPRPGTGGVGLAICKAVVEAHGGTIRAANREAGGASFRVELPDG